MKAARFYGAGDVRVEEVDAPKLEPEGIILRVEFCGICGTEVHYYKRGIYDFKQESWGQVPGAPRIMGHEPSGEVVEVGSDVVGIEPGMRVTVGGGGAFAEYMSVPRAVLDRNVFVLPDDMSNQVGSTVEIVGSTVRGVKRAEPHPDDVVVVVGAGVLGQCVWQAFKGVGVEKVIVSGFGRKRLEVARSLGADVIINAAEENVVERIMEITSGRGADIVADCAGSASSLVQAGEMVRAGRFYGARMKADGSPVRADDMAAAAPSSDGGKVMMMATYEVDVTWQPTSFFFKDARIIASCGGPYGDAIEVMQAGKVNTEPLVTHEYPLDQATEAFEMAANPEEAIKVMLKP